MNLQEKYYHWVWGENHIRPDKPNYLINLELGISIKFDYADGMFQDYEGFYESVADVQFLFGKRPGKERLEDILTDAYNFLGIEERLLDMDLEDIEAEIEENNIEL